MRPFRFPAALATAALASGLHLARAQPAPVSLPEMAVHSTRVANQDPVATFAMPVTVLRYEPGVDVQARNFAESQADVALRGGTFENTGFKIGGLALYDPQTGHYFAEIPVAAPMLAAPDVLTGSAHAVAGWNATAGTVAYGWDRIRPGGFVTVGAGEYDSFRGDLYAAFAAGAAEDRGRVGFDFAAGHSESDGSVPFGDHRFTRATARLQLERGGAQTDLVAGRQRKFFGWPNLYTPFNSPESEDLETTLLALNHRRTLGADGGYVQLAAYHRENYDDYRFNRFAPVGPVLPFEHTTWVYGASLDGRWVPAAGPALRYRAGVVTDELKSTSLTFGRFRTRTHVSAGLFPEWRLGRAGAAAWVVSAGAAFDDTNRDGSAVSPAIEIARETPGAPLGRIYATYAKTTQVPTYTALNASATAGLFRGNPDLGRSASHNLEAGARFALAGWEGTTAVFFRRDDRLVDWTFRQGVSARSASAVDIDTTGVEIFARRSFARVDLVLGYAWLHKDADYGPAAVDASFYALNFPRHRLTAALVARLGGGFELRLDNEARVQQENPLRAQGGDEALLTSLGLHYRPPAVPALELALQVDNLWDSDFQEVPAVPAGRRQVGVGATWRW